MPARYLSREEAKALADRVLSFSQAEQARVNISSGSDGNTRFAVNQISTAGDVTNATVVVTSAFGKKVAAATTNRFDDASLQRTVETSERLARLVPDDPEYLGELGPQDIAAREGVFESTANLTPEQRVQAINAVTGPAAERDLVSTGFLVHSTGSQAVATSKGLFAYGALSNANFTTTVRTPDGTGSGWAGTGAYDWTELQLDELAQRAIKKAEQSRNPRAVEPGRWTVILEPTAVGNMVGLMMGSLSARSADEGRSFFSKQGGGNRIGEQFVDERVTIYSDPMDPRLLATPFNNEGLPNRRMLWVEDGVLRNLVYDRFWATKSNRTATGFPGGYFMEGGDATIEDMIASTERGLLVTRFWYIRGVDPRTILFTGLSRDGTFLIENGRISHAVKNLRWNESPIFMLNNIEMMGRPVRISPSESSSLASAVIVPPVKARDFNFTSISDAV
ncbi:MAG: TldD/PmbA family protein [Longimicrobiales bacterium]